MFPENRVAASAHGSPRIADNDYRRPGGQKESQKLLQKKIWMTAAAQESIGFEADQQKFPRILAN